MTKPSWGDFATFDESAYPELWDGMIGAWCPFMGATGMRQHDLSRSMNWQNATSLPSYDLRDGVTAIVGNPTISATTPTHYLGLTEATMFAWLNKSAQGDVVACAPLVGANQSRFGITWFSDGFLYVSIEAQGSTGAVARSLPGAGTKVICVQYRGITGNTVSRITVDGVATTHSAFPPSLRTTVSTSSLTTDGFSSTSANGAIFALLFWRRCMTNSEVAEITRIGLPALFQRRRRTLRRVGVEQGAAFRAYWARRQNQIIGGGV